MNKQEFATFAMALRTYYPKENILPNKEAMALWFREVQDIPFPVAEAALRKWVATNKWSPSIAEIREMTAGIQNGEQLTWGEAWERALRAVRSRIVPCFRYIPRQYSFHRRRTRRCSARLCRCDIAL
jgi:hypothetical protein